MPFKKTYKKRTYRRKPYKKGGLVKAIKSVHLKMVPKKEIRFNPSVATLYSTTVPLSFTEIILNNISPGDNLNQRNGSKIYMKGVSYDFTFSNDHTKTRKVRFMIVGANNKSGDTLDNVNWSDIYQSATFGNRTPDAKAGDLTAVINKTVLHTFCDKHYTVKPNTDGATEIRGYCKIGKYCTFDDTGSTTALMSGKIRLVLQSVEVANDAPKAANNHMYGVVRVFYRDA